MRDEVCAARLLRQSERQSGQYSQRQAQFRETRVPLAKDEVYGEERVTGASVRRGKAMTGAQRVGSVGEQLDVGETAAERDEVPGAIDIRHRLEQADDAPREQHRERKEGRRSPVRAPVAPDKGRAPERQRNRRDRADGPTATGMEQLVRDPLVLADPLPAGGIEEERTSDVRIERRERKGTGDHDEDRERNLQLRPPVARGLHDVQNDRLVSMRSCMLSMSLLRSSGKARSMCSTLPSPERALPSRRPTPTSLSQPDGAAA